MAHSRSIYRSWKPAGGSIGAPAELQRRASAGSADSSGDARRVDPEVPLPKPD